MLSWELRSSIKRCPGYWGFAYQAQGRSKESELSHIYLSKELMVNMLFYIQINCSYLDECYSCCSFVFIL